MARECPAILDESAELADRSLEEELRESESRLRQLVEAGRRLGSSLDLRTLYTIMRDVIVKAMPCDGVLVSVYDRSSNRITCDYAWIGGNLIDTSTFPPLKLAAEGGGMQSTVIRTGKSLIFGDVRAKVQEPGGTYYEVNAEGTVSSLKEDREPEVQSMAMVPLKLNGVVVGVLQVSSHTPAAFSQEHLRLLEGLVQQLAVASQNARLYDVAQEEIRERRKAEEALRVSESALWQTLDAMPQIAWSVQSDGQVNYVNRRLLEYAGVVDPAEAMGASGWTRIVHPEDAAACRDQYQECVTRGQEWTSELRLRRWDGVYRWHLSRMVPIRDLDGNIIRWFGTSTDVHDLKVASSALTTLLDNAPGCIFRIDRDRRWLFVNAAFEQIVEYEADNCLGLTPLEAGMPPEIAVLVEQGARNIFDEGSEARLEFSFKGRHYLCRAVGESGAGGEIDSALFISTDITDRKEAEMILRDLNEELERRVTERTTELLAAVREMEGFTYSVSHDLRAPLRAITANSRILLAEASRTLDPDMQDLLEKQAKAATRLGILIDELLRLSRISRYEMTISRIDLSDLARAVAEEVTSHPWEVMPAFSIQEALIAYGDERLVKLVLWNLVDNAVKFSPGGARVEIGSSQEGVYFVRDHGVGLDVRYAEKLWLPFERLVRDDEFPGTGIGLANVKRIIDRHGGKVWVESEPGQGSTFHFTLEASVSVPTAGVA